MLSALRLRLSKLVSIFNKQTNGESADDNNQPGPWRENLRELAKERLARMGAEPEPQNEEITNFVNDLAHAAGDVDPQILKAKRDADRTAQNAEAIKTKRIMDGTVQDIKAWYGQAVATWDPVNENSIDSIEKKGRTRAENHWFH